MNKNLFAVLLCAIVLGCLSSCGGKRNTNECAPKTCQTRYAYDECDACYELEANAAEVTCEDTDTEMICKF